MPIRRPQLGQVAAGRESLSVCVYYYRVYLRTNGRNERAIRAYRACGFVEEGRLREQVYSDGRYDDQVWMGILRADWEPN